MKFRPSTVFPVSLLEMDRSVNIYLFHLQRSASETCVSVEKAPWKEQENGCPQEGLVPSEDDESEQEEEDESQSEESDHEAWEQFEDAYTVIQDCRTVGDSDEAACLLSATTGCTENTYTNNS